MTFQQFLLILRARLKVILLILIGTVGTTLGVSLVIPKQYTGTASVLVDTKAVDPLTGILLPAQMLPGYLATQIDIITSPRVGQRVVRMLKLDTVESVRADWQEETGGKVPVEVWLSEVLAKKLDVKPSRESSVVSISYTGAEPRFASALANAYAQAYIDTSLDLKVEPARQSAAWFSERSKTLRENLEKAQSKLSSYQQEHGIVAADERIDFETARLNELSTQLAVAQGSSADAQSRNRQATGTSSDTIQEVIQNPLISQLRADIARQEAKLQDLASQLGRNHPQLQRAEAELASLREKLISETRRVTQGVGSTARVGQQRESELKVAIEAQKKKVLDIKKQRDEVAVLQRDVESAQKGYDAVAQRFTQSSLEGQSSQTNIVLLTPATDPVEPSRPRILLNVLIAVFLGTLLGVGTALVLEMLDQRVRSPEDIAQMLELHVLGVIPVGGRKLRRGKGLAGSSANAT